MTLRFYLDCSLSVEKSRRDEPSSARLKKTDISLKNAAFRHIFMFLLGNPQWYAEIKNQPDSLRAYPCMAGITRLHRDSHLPQGNQE
jgi:hypothetical protein